MKIIIAFAALLASAHVRAGDDVSTWDTAATCQPARTDHRCFPYQASLQLHHIGDEYCGPVNETTDKHSPSAWFSGRRDGSGLLVRYVDSFQASEDTFGWARVDIRHGRLAWHVLLRPEGSRIDDEDRFHRVATPASATSAAAGSCAALEAATSGLDVHLAQAPRAATVP